MNQIKSIFAFVLLPIRGIIDSDIYANNTVYKPFEINQFPFTLQPSGNQTMWSFAYQPKNSDIVNKLMTKVSNELNLNLVRKLNIQETYFFYY